MNLGLNRISSGKIKKISRTRPGVDKVNPKVWFKYSLQIDYQEQCKTVPPCSFQHGRPAFGPSCTEFVFPECWHFDNYATSKIDDVLTEHGGLLHVLPLSVHLKFFGQTSRGIHSDIFLLFDFFLWDPSFIIKSCGWW